MGTLREIDGYKGKSDASKRTLEEFAAIAKSAAELMERAQEMFDSNTYGATMPTTGRRAVPSPRGV